MSRMTFLGAAAFCVGIALAPAARARPVGQAEETLLAAMERSPMTVIGTVVEVQQSSETEETAALRVDEMLRCEASIDLATDAPLLVVADMRIDHAVRFRADDRAIVFLRPAKDGHFQALAALWLVGEQGVALEEAARDLATAMAIPDAEARDAALAEVLSRQACESTPFVARDAAIELVRKGPVRERMKNDARSAIVARLKGEKNTSMAKTALIELCGTLKAAGTTDALVAALGDEGSARLRELAGRALVHVGDPEAPAMLREALKGAKGAEAKVSVIAALGTLQVELATDEIIATLDDAAEDVRVAAVEALAKIGTEKARARVEQAAKDDASEKVRSLASEAARRAKQ